MAYLHCHGCGWQQDDFWKLEGYNPLKARRIAELCRDLFKDEIRLEHETISGREFVIRELKRIIHSIEHMSVPTWEEWKAVKAEWVCPECGSKEWDID